jgi:hypothetical protein
VPANQNKPSEATVSIPATQVFRIIKRLVTFPYPQICVHSVAADLLSALEDNGLEATPDFVALARAVVRAEDEDALEILSRVYGVTRNA